MSGTTPPPPPQGYDSWWPATDCSVIDSGDTAVVGICAILTLIMTPGISFFYGGLVHRHTVISILMQCITSMALTSIVWAVWGFSLAFGESGGGFMGSPSSYPFFSNLSPCTPLGYPMGRAGTVPGMAFSILHMCYAMLAPAIITGSFAERMRFPAFCLFLVFWIVLVYCPLAHWLWSPAGFLYKWGARDFSGGAVVHISAGCTALASLFIVGSRRYESEGHRQILQEPHDRTMVALGTAILWFGWLGYTGGSTMGSGGQFVFAEANTIMAASVSMLCWMSLEWFNTGMPSMVGACMGVIAGLSAITAAAGFVLPWAAMLIGLLGSCACYFSVWLIKERLRMDDALDVWGVHAVGGGVGMILVGALADAQVGGIHRDWDLLGKQLATVLLTSAWSFLVSIGLLALINRMIFVIPSDIESAMGLDKSMHGEYAYDEDSRADAIAASTDPSYIPVKSLSVMRIGPTAMELEESGCAATPKYNPRLVGGSVGHSTPHFGPQSAHNTHDMTNDWPRVPSPHQSPLRQQNYGVGQEHEMDVIQHHDEQTAVSAAVEQGVSDNSSTLVAVQQALRVLENRRFV